MEFHLPQTMATPTLDDTCCRIDVLETILSGEAMSCHSVDDPLDVICLYQKCVVFKILLHQFYARYNRIFKVFN